MTIPKSWNELTIEQYYLIDSINNLDISNEEKHAKILEIFSPVKNLSVKAFKKLCNELGWMSEFNISTDLVERFRIGETIYNVKLDIEKYNAGQYMEIKSFAKDPETVHRNLHNILAVIAPSDTDHKERAALFETAISMEIAYPLVVFFCNLWSNLIDSTQSYLKDQAMDLKRKGKIVEEVTRRSSMNTMAGLLLSMIWLTQIDLNGITSLI